MSVSQSFNVGDVIRLNSGGPELTVVNVSGPNITAVWIQEDGYGQLPANVICFKLVRRAHEDHK